MVSISEFEFSSNSSFNFNFNLQAINFVDKKNAGINHETSLPYAVPNPSQNPW